jgi:carbon storage regulator
MLVLTRKLMEKLFIGDDICVTVVRLEGGQVRLGIEAPREVSVVRAELVPERLTKRAKARPRRRIEPTPPGVPPRPTW